MESNNRILKVIFWFGVNRPTSKNDEYLSYKFELENIVEEYKQIESFYNEFKKRNPNPTVPYKNQLINEECIIFFHDIEPQYSTFQEIYLMMKQLESVELEQKQIESEIERQEKQKFEVLEEVFNNQDAYNQDAYKQVSLNDILTTTQFDVVISIFNNTNNSSKFEKSLKKYLKTIKLDLEKKGICYKYLVYALSYSLVKEAA